MIEQRHDRTVFAGWARHGTRRVDRVAVFVDGDADHYIHTAVPQKDVVKTSNTPSLWEKQWIRLDKHLSLSGDGEADQGVDTEGPRKDVATEVKARSPQSHSVDPGFCAAHRTRGESVWHLVVRCSFSPEVQGTYGRGDGRIVLGKRSEAEPQSRVQQLEKP